MARKKMTATNAVDAALVAGPQRRKDHPSLSTGVTVFNLALTGDVAVGLQAGTYAFIVGDSSAGKSFLATTIAANAAIDPHYKHYEIIYDDVENGALFDIGRLYSPTVAARIKPPTEIAASEFVEEFYANANAAMDRGPCVYILDSENALTSKEEAAKTTQVRQALVAASGKGVSVEAALKVLTGQMTDGKARKHSMYLRKLVGKVEQTGSVLVILGQTRDNLTDTYSEVTYSGGRALKFYAHIMAMMSVGKRITKKVHDIDREIGMVSRFKIIKNRYVGKRVSVEAPIYYSVGYDEIGSMVDWLVLEQAWSANDGMIDTESKLGKGRRETLVKKIDNDPAIEAQVRELVSFHWEQIEARLRVERRNRYTVDG